MESISPSFETLHKKMRQMIDIQFQEFYRQIKTNVVSPDTLLEDWDHHWDNLENILASKSKPDLEVADYLDAIAAEFMMAFLTKLDNEFPDEGEE